MRKQRRGERGFTLLELLMVVIIIAILASIAVPQYLRTVTKARRAEAIQVLGTIRGGLMRYQAEHGHFTDLLTELDIDYGAFAQSSWSYTADETGNPLITVPTVIATATGNIGTTVNGCIVTINNDGAITSDVDTEGLRSGSCVNPDS